MATKAQHASAYRNLPDLLRAFREEAELNQRALGDRLKQPQSWIHNSETGNRRVDLAEFCFWCEACGVDPAKGLRRYLQGRR